MARVEDEEECSPRAEQFDLLLQAAKLLYDWRVGTVPVEDGHGVIWATVKRGVEQEILIRERKRTPSLVAAKVEVEINEEQADALVWTTHEFVRTLEVLEVKTICRIFICTKF